MSDTCRTHVGCRTCETITNLFPDLKNPTLDSIIIKIGPKLCIFENILKIVNFADWSGKLWKLLEEAHFDFLTTSST